MMNPDRKEEKSKNIGETIEETRQYHIRFHRAVNNPERRKILKALKYDSKTAEDLESNTGLEAELLSWHLSILERGSCIEKVVKEDKMTYQLTQEGRVIDHLE